MTTRKIKEGIFDILGFSILRNKKARLLTGARSDVHYLFNAYKNMLGLEHQHSQLGQDIFALMANGGKRNGFFVEFGATNGYDLSNTYILEKKFGWQGILAEPAPLWHDDLKKNRSSFVDFDCVWSKTGEMLEFDIVNNGAELSTISKFSESDKHAESRVDHSKLTVKTISLEDLLAKYNAPEVVDYISIDTEGSEYDILRSFDFTRHRFNALSVEHNNSPARGEIYSLLNRYGYKRVLEDLSKWDDWYVPG